MLVLWVLFLVCYFALRFLFGCFIAVFDFVIFVFYCFVRWAGLVCRGFRFGLFVWVVCWFCMVCVNCFVCVVCVYLDLFVCFCGDFGVC